MKKWLTIVIAIVFLLGPAQQANAQDDADFAQLFDDHGAIMLLIDDQTGAILYANKAAVSFYGYTKQELESISITQINTLSLLETQAEMQAAIQEERNYFAFKHRLASGEVRDVQVFSYPVMYKGKECLYSIIHDVTEKMMMDQRDKNITLAIYIIGGSAITGLFVLITIISLNTKKLKKSKEEIENFNELRQTFVDADESLVYLKNENLKYVFVNKALERFYGKKSSEIIGVDDFELTDMAFAKLRRQTDEAVLEKRARIVDEVVWNGHIYQTTKFPVKLINGSFGMGAYIRDITEQRNHEMRLEKALIRNKILVDVLTRSFENNQKQLDYVLHKALKLTESKYGYIYLYDEERQEFVLNSWSDDVMEECAVIEKQTTYCLENTGMWGEVVRQRKPIIINDFGAPHPLKKGYPKGHVDIKRFMSLPVVIDGRIVAVVGLANKQSDYDDFDVDEMTVLMNGVWNAVERRQAEEKLVLERNKYLQTIVSIGDGVLVVNREGSIEMLNAVAQELTGWTQDQAVGRHYKEVFKLSHEDEVGDIADPIKAVYETDMIQELGNNAVLTSKDGKKYYLEDSAAPIRDENEKTVGVVLVFRDVTDKKEQRQRIEYLSYHDALTGLYNRRFFEEELNRINTERNLPLSMIMGDVNGLKLTNDIFGHTYGDMLLKKVSEVFRKTCRADDIIARWGGDEFVILLPKTTEEEAKNIIARIKAEFDKVHIKAIKGSISLGSETKTVAGDDILEILDRAESKMYIAKTLEREDVKNHAIKAIISALHETHPREKGHSERVSEMSLKMGRLFRLNDAEIHKLKFGGFLHDIGKIVLDTKLLDKNHELTDSELNEMKKHTTVGYRILNSFDDTVDLAEAALYHHERWDGQGYPKGIKGKDIPLLARIVAIVECYDRMLNPSQGTAPKTKAEAMQIIHDGAGTRFDPQMVKLFEKMIRSF